MAFEFNIFGLNIRLSYKDNDLTRIERDIINTNLQSVSSYKNVDELVNFARVFSSPKDMADYYRFKSTRDFFLAEGWDKRLEKFLTINN